MSKFLVVFFLMISYASFGQDPEQKLIQLGIELPQVPDAIGTYVDAVKVGNLVFLSGKGPRRPDGEYIKGRLGKDLTVQEGYDAARLTGLIQLAVLKKELGSLKKVKRIVKVNGYVHSADGFSDQPKVINGYSDLMISVFGNMGRHARTAVGTNTLPLGMAVEVEMVVELN